MNGEFYEDFFRKLEDLIEEQRKPAILNPIVMMRILSVYQGLKELARGTDTQVECHLREPHRSMGYVSVSGCYFDFREPQLLENIARWASGVEIVPKTDGTVEVDIYFYGLTEVME